VIPANKQSLQGEHKGVIPANKQSLQGEHKGVSIAFEVYAFESGETIQFKISNSESSFSQLISIFIKILLRDEEKI
jgi:hypothetical protein